jgi:hypothetical protein
VIVRALVRWLLAAWLVAPVSALGLAVLAGSVPLERAVELAVWLVLPWLVMLAGIVLVRAALGPPPPSRTR